MRGSSNLTQITLHRTNHTMPSKVKKKKKGGGNNTIETQMKSVPEEIIYYRKLRDYRVHLLYVLFSEWDHIATIKNHKK